jgi:hypothetical protein
MFELEILAAKGVSLCIRIGRTLFVLLSVASISPMHW